MLAREENSLESAQSIAGEIIAERLPKTGHTVLLSRVAGNPEQANFSHMDNLIP
jgi:hypothetical protein